MQLDKQADYLIADHARKDVPAGSYSWKWIEDSVKGGRLMDKENYSISPPGSNSRPRGSTQQKGSRNAFTKEDDMILMTFVTKHEREGTATSGNVIYKQLESKVCRVHMFTPIPADICSIHITRTNLGGIDGSRNCSSYQDQTYQKTNPFRHFQDQYRLQPLPDPSSSQLYPLGSPSRARTLLHLRPPKRK